MAQASRFHMQSLVLQQGELFRQDVRDLISNALTVQQSFLLFATLLANAVVKLYTGAPPHTPDFDIRLFNLTCTSALVYMLSAMFYILWAHNHTATCEREMLTTTMRLPIEDLREELETITQQGVAENYEKQGFRKMLRIPGMSRLMHRSN